MVDIRFITGTEEWKELMEATWLHMTCPCGNEDYWPELRFWELPKFCPKCGTEFKREKIDKPPIRLNVSDDPNPSEYYHEFTITCSECGVKDVDLFGFNPEEVEAPKYCTKCGNYLLYDRRHKYNL
jgi:predicted Zn-ribbon and HTH transcriptional regulator